MIEDLKGMKETIAYGSSQFRLMKNQETEDYPPHWHTSIEIIMPLENGYQAVIGNECYKLNPLDLLFINSGEIHSLQAPATGKRLIFQAPLSLWYGKRTAAVTGSCLPYAGFLSGTLSGSVCKIQGNHPGG